MKIGRRLGIKILNASKFVLGRLDGADIPGPDAVSEPLDKDLLSLLAKLMTETTDDFESYDYARALERTETFFWSFCDDYVELVKIRAYGGANEIATDSARATLAIALSVLQRLFAPILPFVTEEVWHWWHETSVHTSPWPTVGELPVLDGAASGSLYRPVCDVLEAIRREKSSAKVSQRAEVASVSLRAPAAFLEAVRSGEDDLKAAGVVRLLTLEESDDIAVVVTLVQEQAS
jgi:valyl-tRNA synthetase